MPRSALPSESICLSCSHSRRPVLESNRERIDRTVFGHEPIAHVTPHSLRRTFASLLLATGADVPYVMAQLGHEDPKMTLGVYAKVIASKTDHGAAVDGLVGASDWAPMGTTADSVELEA